MTPLDAARLLAERDLPRLLVLDSTGAVRVLPGSQVVRRWCPRTSGGPGAGRGHRRAARRRFARGTAAAPGRSSGPTSVPATDRRPRDRAGDRRADGAHPQPAGRRRRRRRQRAPAGARVAASRCLDATRSDRVSDERCAAWAAVAVFAVAYVRSSPSGSTGSPPRSAGRRVMLLIGATDAEHAFFSPRRRHRLERHLPAARHDAHRRRAATHRPVRVPGDLGGQTRPGRPFRVMVILVVDHRGRLGAAGQRHHRAAGRPGHAAGLRPARAAGGAVPDRRGDGVQHRRHRHPDRRPAEHHHRQPVRADLQRLPDPSSPRSSLVLLVVFLGLCRWLFRDAFRHDPARVARGHGAAGTRRHPRPAAAGHQPRRARRWSWPRSCCTPCCTWNRRWSRSSAGCSCSRCPGWTPSEVAKDVEWPTLVFFAGLFIMVGALVNTGVIGQLSPGARPTPSRASCGCTTMLLLWASAVLSAIVDNIPYVATMSPIVADLVNADGTAAGQRAVVGPGPRRRPGRQRHRHRRLGQRRRPRHRRTRRHADLASGSSPSTASSSPSSPSRSACRTCGCATSPWPDRTRHRPTGTHGPQGADR